jgi:hypothetical protein
MLMDALEALHDRRERKLDQWPRGTLISAVWEYAGLPDELGLFWDWASLVQRDPFTLRRSPVEERAFTLALGDLELWFAHYLTTALLLTASAQPTRPGYLDSGWTTYESLVARLNKMHRADLWPAVLDVGDPENPTVTMPPVPLADFAAELERLHFTNGADKAIVRALYERTLRTTLGASQRFQYDSCGWGEHEMKLLTKVLPQCNQLLQLTLSYNNLGLEAVELFTTSIAFPVPAGSVVLPNLKELDLSGNPIGLSGAGESIRNSRGVQSGHTGFALSHLAWALSPVKVAGKDGSYGGNATLLRGNRPAALAGLQVLRLQGCGIEPYAFRQFCNALLPNALRNLSVIDLSDEDKMGIAARDFRPLLEALDRGALSNLRSVVQGSMLTVRTIRYATKMALASRETAMTDIATLGAKSPRS